MGRRADALHVLEDLGDVVLEFVVDEDQPFRCDANGHVSRLVQQAIVAIGAAASVRRARIERTADDVEAVFDLLDLHRLGRLRLLCRQHARERESGHRRHA